MLRLIIERLRKVFTHRCCFQGQYAGVYPSYFVFRSIQCTCAWKTRLHWEEGPTLTSRFVQRITTILLPTSTLDLNLAMPTACELSENLSPTVRIRTVHLRKDCMPSGREAMLKLL